MTTAIEGLFFHEATVSGIEWKENSLLVKLEGVHTNDSVADIEVIFPDVRAISVDGRIDAVVSMEMPDGEVIELKKIEEGRYQFIVEWHGFKTRETVTKCYIVECSSPFYMC